jgi:hypothetical protein
VAGFGEGAGAGAGAFGGGEGGAGAQHVVEDRGEGSRRAGWGWWGRVWWGCGVDTGVHVCMLATTSDIEPDPRTSSGRDERSGAVGRKGTTVRTHARTTRTAPESSSAARTRCSGGIDGLSHHG